MNSLKLYFKYIKLNIESQLQYKASFIMMSVGHFLITFIEFLGVWALFDRFKNINGFTLPEVALFYGIINIAFAITEMWMRGFDIFPSLVKSGDFDRMLLRPRTTVLQLLGQDFQIMRIGRMIQGLVILLWSIFKLDISWTIDKSLLLIGSILGGNLLFSGIIIIQATISFWSVESLEIMNSFTYGGVQAAQYPISIYKKWFRNILIYIIPLATVNYFPAISILGKSQEFNYPSWIGFVSPLVGCVFFLITLLLWETGVKHYTSTGN